MTIEEIISHIDAEISRLTEARDLVAGTAVGKVSRSPRKSGLAAPKPRAVRSNGLSHPKAEPASPPPRNSVGLSRSAPRARLA